VSKLFPDKRRKKAESEGAFLARAMAVAAVSAMLILFALAFVASAFYVLARAQQKEPAFVHITTTTSSTTTTTSAPPTTLTAYTTLSSTTVSTTTTLPCGGDYEPPCFVDEAWVCNDERILGSDFLCKEVSCAPTVPSGRIGCGSWALDWFERCKNKLMPGPR
jgi:hypothetical protein